MKSATHFLSTVAILLAAGSSLAAQPLLRGEELEASIKQYLLKNPEIIREAMKVLQTREEAAKAQQVKDAIAANGKALLEDERSPVIGNPNGDVTIVEFFDYRCGYCKRLRPALEALIERDPQVRVVLKELPILGPESTMAAKAALAAHKRGKYLDFHQALMGAEDLSQTGLQAIAERAGLGNGLLSEADTPAIEEAIQSNFELSNRLNISGTPALVIGDRVLPGAANVETLALMVTAQRLKAIQETNQGEVR